MAEPTRPTIFALSSGRGPAAIAVIRISGSRAGNALKALTGKIPSPRQAALARVSDPRSGEIIDEALALWFPAPASETGEDTAELQLHGGRAVIAAVLDALATIEGLKPAEAGEFTRRAFENGKLDLTAVEGLADLVDAETQGQRRQAFRQMKGLLGGRAETWRQRLISALALVEAGIDFSDEGDVQNHKDIVQPALTIARELAGEIETALADGGRGERLRDGLVVAIAGPPNAGKSTLLNLIAKREAAIVSPYAGTTRDVIEVHLDLGGWPVTLLDTAGIRETGDPVEMEGVRRARERAAGADLVLWVVDASGGEGAGTDDLVGHVDYDPPPEVSDQVGVPSWTPRTRTAPLSGWSDEPSREYVRQTVPPDAPNSPPVIPGRETARNPEPQPAAAAFPSPSPLTWLVHNKIDLVQGAAGRNESEVQRVGSSEPKDRSNKSLRNIVNSRLTHKNEPVSAKTDLEFNISATSGEGFDRLLDKLAQQAGEFLSGAESSLVTRARHRHALTETLAALRRALSGKVSGHEDILAEELRIAARALGRLTGRVDVEDVLDVIFRDFCIGK